MQSISFTYGKSVGPDASSVLSVMLTTAPFTREFAGRKLPKAGASTMICVGQDMSSDGCFYTENRTAKDGTVLMLQVRETRRGTAWQDGAVFLRCRAAAAQLVVYSQLCPNPRATIDSSLPMFIGRADILSLEELEDEYGIVPARHFVTSYMNLEEIDELFDIRETAPQIAAAPVIETATKADGETIQLVHTRRARRMKLK